jgi:hypothetical protein
MIAKSFDEIGKVDIESLVTSRETEGREIEYKKLLPGNSDEDKREFLHDASSFANATGGDLIFGIEAADGVPTAALGVPTTNADGEVLRLENIVRTSLDPRLLGLRTKAIPGFQKGPVILMRIPKSWAAPHMVTLKNSSRFFTRNSAGKHQMDVTEIRSAFLLSEGLADRLRRFRDQRLGMIVSGEPAGTMNSSSLVVCHLLPLAEAEIKLPFEPSMAQQLQGELRPLGYTAGSGRYNIDGFFVHYDSKSQCQGYCQLFRTGAIEAANAQLMTLDAKMLFASGIEEHIIKAVESYLPVLERFVALSL